jgi:ribosomal protein S18 acetylase RimI-like enzyme
VAAAPWKALGGIVELVYRRATAADADALARLRIEFVRIVKDSGVPDEAEYERALSRYFGRGLAREKLLAWLCLDGGEAIASMALRIDKGGRGYVMSVYTRPSYRRLGIASRLIGLLIEEAKSRRLERLSLHPTADGLPLYLRLGFRPFRTIMILRLAPKKGRTA